MGQRATTRSLKRRPASREWRRKILVVTEGEETEGIYVSHLVRGLQMANVSVQILGRECGSDPQTVVEFARDRFVGDPSIDVCFCVIDRDSHNLEGYNRALALSREMNNKSPKRSFRTFVSDPCIELWFILHFTYWRSPFVKEGKRSRADCAVNKLQEYLPAYQKSSRVELAKLVPLTDEAVANAKRVAEDAIKTGEANPSTEMHEFVTLMREEAVRYSS